MNLSNQVRHHIWSEKYRPMTVDETILPQNIKDSIKGYVQGGKIPNLLFVGGSGTGKSSTAHAICNELDFDVLFINGSDEGRLLDTLRNKIKQFASTNSLDGKRKCIIIDEIDNVTQDTQMAMRSAMDEHSKHCSIIATCNYPKRIIEGILSRFTVVEFLLPVEEKKALCGTFMKRVIEILDLENIEYDKRSIAAIIVKCYPDWRKCLNALQGYASKGKIDSGILTATTLDVQELSEKLKNKDFAWVRNYVFTQPSIDISVMVRSLDEYLYTRIDGSSVPESILIYARYEDMFVRAIDPHITVLAMLTELMGTLEFRN